MRYSDDHPDRIALRQNFLNCGQNIVPVFLVYCNRIPCYPIVVGYSSTIYKVIGQKFPHITLVFNSRYMSPAVGYVALSRGSSLHSVVPMLRLRKTHFLNF